MPLLATTIFRHTLRTRTFGMIVRRTRVLYRTKLLHVLLERVRPSARPSEARLQLGHEEPRLLQIRHEDLRVSTEHVVKRGRPALGMPDDHEVGHPPGAIAARGHLSTRHRHSPTASRGRGRDTRSVRSRPACIGGAALPSTPHREDTAERRRGVAGWHRAGAGGIPPAWRP